MYVSKFPHEPHISVCYDSEMQHLCGSRDVDVINTDACAANHLQSPLGRLEHLLRDLGHHSNSIISFGLARLNKHP